MMETKTEQDELIDVPEDDLKKILVVDDILYVVKSIAKILREEGYFVITALNGREAVEKVEKYSPGLITIDHNLTDMVGTDLIKKIRKLRKDKPIKVVYISAVYNRPIIKSVINIGVDYYLIKPFKKAKLIEVVDNLLNTN